MFQKTQQNTKRLLPIHQFTNNYAAQLFYLAANARFQSSAIEKIKSLLAANSMSKDDWICFLDLVIKNEVLAVLYPIFSELEFVNVPAEIESYFRYRYTLNSKRNKILGNELIYINRLFLENNISIINYKGPETLQRCNKSILEWQFNDLDFLLPISEVEKACSILEQAGYKHIEELGTLDDNEGEHDKPKDLTFIRDKARESGHKIPSLPQSLDDTMPLIIEPHFSLVHNWLPLSMDQDGFFERVQYTPFNDEKIPVFSEEDLLYVLSVSGCKSGWKNFKLIIMLAWAIENLANIDWLTCLQRAEDSGGKKMLLLGVLLASALVGVRVPEPLIKQATRDRRILKLAQKIAKRLLTPTLGSHHQPLLPKRFCPTVFGTLDRFALRSTYLWRSITTPTQLHRNRIPLPSALGFLYRILVPIHDCGIQPMVRLLKRTTATSALEINRDAFAKNYSGVDALKRFRAQHTYKHASD